MSDFQLLEGRVRNVQTGGPNARQIWIARSENGRSERLVYELSPNGEWRRADVIIVDNGDGKIGPNDYFFKFRNGNRMEVTDDGIQTAVGWGPWNTMTTWLNDAFESLEHGELDENRYGPHTLESLRPYFSGDRDWVFVYKNGNETPLPYPISPR